MKRILFSIVLMLVGMSAWAQNWEAPSENDYPGSTPVYVKVNVNGTEQVKAQVAAFIGDECRAVSAGAETQTGDSQSYLLRVWGDPTADQNKEITFKVAWGGLVFGFKETVTWTGNTHEEVPLVLNVDMPTGVTLPDPLKIETQLVDTYDLTGYTSSEYFIYKNEAGEQLVPSGESTIETELTYEWEFSNSSAYFTVDDKNILTALQETGEAGASLSLIVSGGEGFVIGGNTQVVITVPEVPVTGITCSPEYFTIDISQNLTELEELKSAITVLPAEATNKEYVLVPADDVTTSEYNNGFFSNPGHYSMNVVSMADRNIYTTIQVEVTVAVQGISLNTPSGTVQAVVGDNLQDLLEPLVEIYPDNATNKEYYFEIPKEASDAIVDNVIFMPGEYTIDIVSDDNPNAMAEVVVSAVQIQAPETLEMEVGENFNTLLEGKVNVYPQGTFTINPIEADGAAFADGMAMRAGTYTLIATCNENSRAMAEIKVTVAAPVVITYPASLTISKLKDTELTLTITEGEDSFDPELLDIWIEGETTGGLPMPTITEVEGSNGLKWNIRGYAVGRYYSYITYNGKLMNNVDDYAELSLALPAEIPFNPTGWDWIYSPSNINFDDPTWLDDGAGNRVIEIRSQTDLLYNDATLGIFGSLYGLTPDDGMYKIKADYTDADKAVIIDLSGDCTWERNPYKAIVKGYNWIGYPNEWDMTVADLNTLGNMAYDGDQIIGKNSFAEYDAASGGWVANGDFYFQAGKGYLYYCTGENGIPNGFSFDFTPESSSEVAPPMGQSVALATQRAAAESVWQYDAGQFADNMAIVAEIPQLDFPADYTVGAFVGDECRGKGSAVLGGKMMISVAGKAGERVTFRLHNELTGEFIDLNETLTYAQRAGSLKNPVVLTSDAIVTGIAEVEASDDAAVQGIFDLSGRRVENMNAGGIYIVKTLENGKVVARKVIK